MAASKEHHVAQSTKTRRQRNPTWLSLPPAVSVPWTGTAWGSWPDLQCQLLCFLLAGQTQLVWSLQFRVLLLWGERKPTSLGTETHSPGPNGSNQCCSCVQGIVKFPLKQFWIEKMQFLGDLCQATSLASEQETKERTLCARFLSLKGIPPTSHPPNPPRTYPSRVKHSGSTSGAPVLKEH